MEISPALPANGRADGGLNLESLRQLPGVLGVVPDAPLTARSS